MTKTKAPQVGLKFYRASHRYKLYATRERLAGACSDHTGTIKEVKERTCKCDDDQ